MIKQVLRKIEKSTNQQKLILVCGLALLLLPNVGVLVGLLALSYVGYSIFK
jgi:hypothetical protein